MMNIDLLYLSPEVFIIVISIVLLMAGAFAGNKFLKPLILLSCFAYLLAIALAAKTPVEEYTGFGGLYVSNLFTIFTKTLILLSAFLVSVISIEFYRNKDFSSQKFFEFPFIVMVAVAGMLLLVSANDIITLYLAIEMQSLALYVLAASSRESVKSSEAGIKYFVLGALASGLLLFGASLVYGYSGTTSFSALTQLYSNLSVSEAALPIAVLVGMILIIIAICFKISAVPFHMWAPDVYEGAPTIITAFFSSAPKIAAIALFIRLLHDAFGGLYDQWSQIVIFVSAASMIVGAVAALRQNNIKRLMAYSSIGHAGYILVGIATGAVSGIQAALIYLALYVFMTIGTFACIIIMKRKGSYFEEISELSGVGKTNPIFAFALSVFMFSMAGIPPLAGFFGKFFIFYSAVEHDLIYLAIIGILSSVVAAYYYLRIVKVMYFDEASKEVDKVESFGTRLVLFIAVLINIFFFVSPSMLFDIAKAAAQAILL